MTGSTFHTANKPSPSISAIPFRHSGIGLATPLLTGHEREQLAVIGTFVHFPRGSTILRRGDHASCVYNLVAGVVKAGSVSAEGRETITAFHFPDDLVGLAESGLYVNTATALEPVSAYRLPLAPLERLLAADSTLELHFLCKLCHELREQQRHAILLASDSARTKIILFLHLLDVQNRLTGGDGDIIRLPMRRIDIANYTGLAVETVSRTLRALSREHLLEMDDTHSVRIRARPEFDALVRASSDGA